MKQRTSRALALGFLGLALVAGIGAVLHVSLNRSRPASPEAPPVSSAANPEAGFDPDLAKLMADIGKESRKTKEAISRITDDEFGSQLWEIGPAESVVFIGVASVGPDGKPQMTETWKGRVPSDFASYIEPVGPGPWLIGRVRKGSGPLEGWNGKSFPQQPLRFCYEITPEGEVVGVKAEDWVKIEELRKHFRER